MFVVIAMEHHHVMKLAANIRSYVLTIRTSSVLKGNVKKTLAVRFVTISHVMIVLDFAPIVKRMRVIIVSATVICAIRHVALNVVARKLVRFVIHLCVINALAGAVIVIPFVVGIVIVIVVRFFNA